MPSFSFSCPLTTSKRASETAKVCVSPASGSVTVSVPMEAPAAFSAAAMAIRTLPSLGSSATHSLMCASAFSTAAAVSRARESGEHHSDDSFAQRAHFASRSACTPKDSACSPRARNATVALESSTHLEKSSASVTNDRGASA
jgi:hypothetical protein